MVVASRSSHFEYYCTSFLTENVQVGSGDYPGVCDLSQFSRVWIQLLAKAKPCRPAELASWLVGGYLCRLPVRLVSPSLISAIKSNYSLLKSGHYPKKILRYFPEGRSAECLWTKSSSLRTAYSDSHSSRSSSSTSFSTLQTVRCTRRP